MLRRGMLFLFVVLVFFIPYSIIQNVTSSAIDHQTFLDILIPFQPGWVWIYHTVLPVLSFVSLVLVRTKESFNLALRSAVITAIVLNIYYILVPTTVARPIFDPQTISEYLVHFTYLIDKPYNCFPSGHAAFAWLATFIGIFSREIRAQKYIIFALILWALGVSFSTLAIKQHYYVDVLMAFVVALTAIIFASIAKKS